MVTLTKQEHIQLVTDANYWHTQFDRRVARETRRESQYRRLFDRLKEEAAKREALLIAELELALARLSQLTVVFVRIGSFRLRKCLIHNA